MGDTLLLKLSINCSICTPYNNRTVVIANNFEMYTYDGQMVAKIKSEVHPLTITSAKPIVNLFAVSTQDYQNLLTNGQSIQSTIFVKVYNGSTFTGEYYSSVKRFEIETPSITINVGNVTATSFVLSLQFKNPLLIPLTSSVLTISGAHIVDQVTNLGTLEAGFVTNDVTVYIDSRGWPVRHDCFIFAKLTTDQVPSFNGKASVHRNSFLKFLKK